MSFRAPHANILVSLLHPTESEGFVVVEMDTRIDKVEDFGVEGVWLEKSSNVRSVETDTIVLRLHMNTTDDATRERRLQRLDSIFLEDGTNDTVPVPDNELVPEQAQQVQNTIMSIIGPLIGEKYAADFGDPDGDGLSNFRTAVYQGVVVSVEYLGANVGEGILVFRNKFDVLFLPPVGKTVATLPSKDDLDIRLEVINSTTVETLVRSINDKGISGLRNIMRGELFVEEPDVNSDDIDVIYLSSAPSARPSSAPSSLPSVAPTLLPSSSPSVAPTGVPSAIPSDSPSLLPSPGPSAAPSVEPSTPPSSAPSTGPSAAPTVSNAPTPLFAPSDSPSLSSAPSLEPSSVPSDPVPSSTPSSDPSLQPTVWGKQNSTDTTLTPIQAFEETITPSPDDIRRLQRDVADVGGDEIQLMINGLLIVYGEILGELFNSTYPGIFKELVLDIIYLGGEFVFQVSGQAIFYNGGPTIPQPIELASQMSAEREEGRLAEDNLKSELQNVKVGNAKAFKFTISDMSTVNLDYDDVYVVTRTESPSASPTSTPSSNPSTSPSESPSSVPSLDPSGVPSTDAPTVSNPPSFEFAPSGSPSLSSEPSSIPSSSPSDLPSSAPSGSPSSSPSSVPSGSVSFGSNE